MIINKCGIYKTNIEYKGGNACSAWTVPSGTKFKVTQIDTTYHKFLSNIFGEWSYWDKDVVCVGEKEK